MECLLWIFWRNMMTSWNGNIFCVTGHLSPVNSLHKGQWRGALMFSLICVWINGWVNNREAGDLGRYRVHYDAIVMWPQFNGTALYLNYHLQKRENGCAGSSMAMGLCLSFLKRQSHTGSGRRSWMVTVTIFRLRNTWQHQWTTNETTSSSY